jgi:hypothetical protein
MPADIAYLRKHYNSLSDEALLDLDRADLTEEAQQCYDDELKDRQMHSVGASEQEDDSDRGPGDAEPEWAGEAACACTFMTSPARNTTPDAARACEILKAAGIDCYLASEKMDENLQPTYQLRVMVPGNVSLLAQSVLDKEIFNQEVEAEWKLYFENLSREELRDADTKKLFSGFVDRIERVTRAYNEEKSRRGV